MSTNTGMNEVKTAVFDFVVAVTVIILTVFLRGIVLSYLWGWFIVPLGMAPIGIGMALGIATLVGFLTFHDLHVKQEHHPAKTRLFLGLFYPLIVFAAGYIYHIYS